MSIYSFGPFILDVAECRLSRDDGRLLSLPGKAWKILTMLVEAQGGLVSHETFRAKLWPEIIVEDRTLTVHMSTLRKALGTGTSSGFIETVAGAGYRLAVPVRVLSAGDSLALPAAVPEVPAMPIAVRTFSTKGLSDGDSYLGAGMADAVTTALSAMPSLAVSPAGAVDRLAEADSIAAGRQLGLGHVLEGSLQLKDEELEVSARLIEIATGRTRWREHFAQPKALSATLENTIAQRVANSLPHPSTAEDAQPTDHPRSPEVYFLQLQARANLKPLSQIGTMKALGLFEQAIALDPAYALAYAGRAATYLQLSSSSLGRPLAGHDGATMARQSAERALALDDTVAEAWAVLGRVKMEYERDWDGAEADLAHAIALNPSSVEALTSYGAFLSAMGHHDEALETLERARRLDPRRLETLQEYAIAYWITGKPDRALAIVAEGMAIAPHLIRLYIGRICILDQIGRHDEAMAERFVALKAAPDAKWFGEQLAELHRSQGWRTAMIGWLTLLERLNHWESAAMQWMAINERDRALDAVEHCVSQRTTYVRAMAQVPSLRPLHGHPRFQQALRALKLDGRVHLSSAAGQRGSHTTADQIPQNSGTK
jgi:serine/threonine-protein kinase